MARGFREGLPEEAKLSRPRGQGDPGKGNTECLGAGKRVGRRGRRAVALEPETGDGAT